MTDVTLFAAAMAGLFSFLSPCVLPLIPGYLSFISGVSLAELSAGATKAVLWRVWTNSVWFVLGFGVVFIAFGASATAIGSFLSAQWSAFRVLAGVVILILGLHLAGIVRLPFLQYTKKPTVNARPLTWVGSFAVGTAFAFGWTPCVGPILAAILALASTQKTMGEGVLLLTIYWLGMGIPFLLTAMGVGTFLRFLSRFQRYLRWVEVASGLLLVVMGWLILTNRLAWLAQYMTFFNRYAL